MSKIDNTIHPTFFVHSITKATFSIEKRINHPSEENLSIDYETENGDSGNITLFFDGKVISNLGDIGLLKKIKAKVVKWVKISKKERGKK